MVPVIRLKWADTPITFREQDCPPGYPFLGCFPLVVSPIIGSARVHRVLVDGGSYFSIITAKTLDLM